MKDEDTRRLRVRILLLRDENTALRDQVDLNNDTNAKLVSRCDDLNTQVEAKIALVRSQEEQLRKQEREYSNLKVCAKQLYICPRKEAVCGLYTDLYIQAELDAINAVNENSANVLAEKLALTRELANLKPEIEHLRSQVNHQQATLAEKLSLERQVDTLEVELANEKKATRRAMQVRESNDRVEDELRRKLRETEKNLTAERAERERLEDQLEQRIRTHTIALKDQDSTRELEADLRKKLQEAQRQLREETEGKERLEEELQNAQRVSKKAQQNKIQDTAEADLRALLEESEKSLAALQLDSNKRQRDQQAAVTELEERNEQLERKMEKARTKYRAMQEELKKAQNDLRKAQQQQVRSSNHEDTMKPGAKMQAFRKRKVQEAATSEFTNIEIQTPSADDAKARRAMKKVIYEPTVVGEKSTFSITPFLNRSKNSSMSDEASHADDGGPEDSILGPQSGSASSQRAASRSVEPPAATVTEPAEAEPTAALPDTDKPQMAPKVRGRPKKVLGDAPSAKKNTLPQKAPKKKLKPESGLEMVSEEAEPEHLETSGTTEDIERVEKTATVKFNLAEPQEGGNDSVPNVEIPKKKKRKVLGSTKTLFDEDDAEAPAVRKPAKVALGGKRAKAPLGGGGQVNAFAGSKTFSPLKRDRRGVGASFLA